MASKIKIDVLKEILLERNTRGYTVSKWNRSRKGSTRPMKTYNRPQALMIKGVKKTSRDLQLKVKNKIIDMKADRRFAQEREKAKQLSNELGRIV